MSSRVPPYDISIHSEDGVDVIRIQCDFQMQIEGTPCWQFTFLQKEKLIPATESKPEKVVYRVVAKYSETERIFDGEALTDLERWLVELKCHVKDYRVYAIIKMVELIHIGREDT